MSIRTLLIVFAFGTILTAVSAQGSAAQQKRRAVQQQIINRAVQGFRRLPSLRLMVNVFVNDTLHESASTDLTTTISRPLKGLGVELIASPRTDIDFKLPLLRTTAEVSCDAVCDILMATALSRDVQVPEDPSLTFRSEVWRRDHREKGLDLASAYEKVRELLESDMVQFARYWTKANGVR